MAKPNYDFPAISFEKKPPGNKWEEVLYEYMEGKPGNKGERIGKVKLKQSKDEKGKEKVTASFHFSGKKESEVPSYAGDVPGNGSWEGESTLHLVGKGDDKGRPTIKVISWNPKRWG